MSKQESRIHNVFFFALRITIGCHLFYEGLLKLFDSSWTSQVYLLHAKGPFAKLFYTIASSPDIIPALDFLNIWGLILIGLGLILGVLTRYAILSGIVLLSLYYLVQPPPMIVNKLFIEIIALFILLYYPTRTMGLENLAGVIFNKRRDKAIHAQSEPGLSKTMNRENKQRREFLKSVSTLPFLGLFGFLFYRNKNHLQADATSGASYVFSGKSLDYNGIETVKDKLPYGKIKNKKISRLILGGNMLGYGGHVHQLKYIKELGRAYNTKDRVFEAMYYAEQLGINAVVIDSDQQEFINEYKKYTGGKMQSIVCCPQYTIRINNVPIWKKNFLEVVKNHPDQVIKAIQENIDKNIDSGADLLYLHGEHCDFLSKNATPEIIAELMHYSQSKHYAFGIGGHTLSGVELCEGIGLNPDFYVKTFHHDRYPSATPVEYRIKDGRDRRFVNLVETPEIFSDNMWCIDADSVRDCMKNIQKPWIAFKILAAGAIPPESGFRYAFENGADFITVGMYDFQILENVKTAVHCLDHLENRTRSWYS